MKITDEELTECVTYLPIEVTGLSADIIVDCGETYKYYDHPLCLFVVDGEDVYPVTISHNSSAIEEYNIPDDVVLFIRQNINTLIAFADLKIDGAEFFDSLKAWKRKLT